MIVWLLLLILFFKDRVATKLTVGITVFSFFLCFATLLNGNEIPYISNIYAYLFKGISYKEYYISTSTHFGFLLYFAYHLFNVLIAKVVKDKFNDDDKFGRFANVCYLCSLIACISFPLIMMNGEFYRITRSLNIITYILLTIYFENYTYNSRSQIKNTNFNIYIGKYAVCSIAFLALCVSFLGEIVFKTSNLYECLFQNNIFF